MTHDSATDLTSPSGPRVARLTPAVPSAIATIGVQGIGAEQIVLAHVQLSVSKLQLKRIYYGLWQVGATTDPARAAEQVVLCRTADNTVEIHCHGGNAVCTAIERQLIAAGGIPASDLELTQPARSTRAAAERELLSAQTDRAAAVLLDQVNGAFDDRLQEILTALENQVPRQALDLIDTALAWSSFGRKLSSAWRVVLAGPPNVGKSSLTNAIVGSARCIVHDTPGTTRDWIEVSTAIDGWPVTITDTAGVRRANDEVERQGIEFSEQQILLADVVVLLVDAQTGWTDTHTSLADLAEGRVCLVAWNKSDLPSPVPPRLPATLGPTEIARVSCHGEPGITELLSQLSRLLVAEIPPPGTAVPFDSHTCDLLRDVRERIASGDLPAAIAFLQATQ